VKRNVDADAKASRSEIQPFRSSEGGRRESWMWHSRMCWALEQASQIVLSRRGLSAT